MFKRSLTAALAFLAIGLSGCSRQSLDAAAMEAMEVHSAAHFQALVFEGYPESEVRTGGALIPSHRYRGATAKVLWKSKPQSKRGMMQVARLEQRMLARTEKGNYFWVTYSHEVEEPRDPLMGLFGSTKPCRSETCGQMTGRATSKKDAMHAIFYSSEFTPELFEEIFGEPAPVRRIDA